MNPGLRRLLEHPRTPVVLWILWGAWFAAMVTMTSIPSPGTDLAPFRGADKVVHLIAYFPFSVLAFSILTWARPSASKGFLFLGFVLSWPVWDELHQLFIPGRSCSVLDMAADYLGILLGVLLVRWLR